MKCGVCPVCGSEEIEFGDIDGKKDTLYQRCVCKDCGAEFDEVFKFAEQIVIEED